MTFSEPVESLDAISTELRDSEPQAPKQLKDLVIRAATHIDDQSHQIANDTLALNLMRGLMRDWADQLDAATNVRIGQMDSDSLAGEKMRAAQFTVIEVVRQLREAAR